MRRMYISSVFRREGERGHEGRIYAIDWDTKVPIWKMETRGVRGMTFVGDRLFIATFTNELRTVDTERGGFIHSWEYPQLSFFHKIYYQEDIDVIVVPSTGSDSVATINPETMEMIENITVGEKGKDTLHFNSMGWDIIGHEYHLYHTPGVVVNVDTKETIFSGLVGAHDLEFIDDFKVIINHSSERKTLVGDIQTRELVPILELPEGPSTTVSQWGWARGAAYHDGMLFIGSAPVDIHMFETGLFLKTDWLRLSDTVEESIFDICLDPRDWDRGTR